MIYQYIHPRPGPSWYMRRIHWFDHTLKNSGCVWKCAKQTKGGIEREETSKFLVHAISEGSLRSLLGYGKLSVLQVSYFRKSIDWFKGTYTGTPYVSCWSTMVFCRFSLQSIHRLRGKSNPWSGQKVTDVAGCQDSAVDFSLTFILYLHPQTCSFAVYMHRIYTYI